MKMRDVGTVLRIGLIAGALDISENLIFNAFRHITPKMVFQYIASGLSGSWAFHAGAASVALGVAIHFAIAIFWTVVFWAASRRFTVLIRRPAPSGLVYGASVYVVMNFLVLPLTRVPRSHAAMSVASRVSGILALLFCIGLTIALLVRREALRSLPGPVRNSELRPGTAA